MLAYYRIPPRSSSAQAMPPGRGELGIGQRARRPTEGRGRLGRASLRSIDSDVRRPGVLASDCVTKVRQQEHRVIPLVPEVDAAVDLVLIVEG